MRSAIRMPMFVCLAALMTMAGCQKVAVEKTYTVGPGEVKTLIVDGPSREQEVTVTVTATSPVDVYIAAEKDVNDANDKVSAPKASFGSKKGIEKDTVTAKVPAKAAYGVILLGTPKTKTGTNVTLNMKGQ
jgi:hypothetical protein